MSTLFIANIRMRDEMAYTRYLSSCDKVFANFRGRYLAVAEPPIVLEGSYPYARTVVIEFPDRAALEAWYYSPEYQAILAHRRGGLRHHRGRRTGPRVEPYGASCLRTAMA